MPVRIHVSRFHVSPFVLDRCNGVTACLAVQFAAIKDVAEFVGSPLSDKELCCIATEGSKDMGSHTASRKDRGQVTSRFGKWKVQ